MSTFASAALTIAMLAAFALLIGGARLARRRDTKGKGVLMIVCAAVLIGNVLIVTL